MIFSFFFSKPKNIPNVNLLSFLLRLSSSVEKLKKLDYAATEEEDVLGKGLYMNGCIDLVLETGKAFYCLFKSSCQ